MRDAARGEADEIPGADLLCRLAHDFGPMTRQHVNRFFFVLVRMKFRRFIPRRDRDQMNANIRSEEHTSELQSQSNLVCRLLLEKKKKNIPRIDIQLNTER